MPFWTALWPGAVAAGLLALQVVRWLDGRRERSMWSSLEAGVAPEPGIFVPALTDGLPEPARRYFLFSIAPGAVLSTTAEIEMTGELGLGDKAKPNYAPMSAWQILAGRKGFVWRLKAGAGWMRLSGSDGFCCGEGWTRFWLWNLIPIVRAGGRADYARSAAGRAIAESLFWLPAALLPSENVRWEGVDGDTARVTVTLDGFDHQADITMDGDGRPRSVCLQRWSRENADREWRLQPFGGTIETIREVDGYRVAGSVTGGNWFGHDEYFPFYKARLVGIDFL